MDKYRVEYLVIYGKEKRKSFSSSPFTLITAMVGPLVRVFWRLLAVPRHALSARSWQSVSTTAFIGSNARYTRERPRGHSGWRHRKPIRSEALMDLGHRWRSVAD